MHSYKVQTTDHLNLHVTHWYKIENSKGTLCIIHGLGEHQERYAHVAKFYSEHGFNVFTYDQRGHGKSEGKRGHSPGLEFNLDDLGRVIETIPKNRLFLYGHSFGGSVVANFLLRKQPNDLSGAILSSPWFELVKEPHVIEFALARLMNKIAPSYTQNNQLDSNFMSNDPLVCKAYREDPLVHNQISVRLFSEFYEAGLWAIKNADKLSIETLLVHGADDQIVSSNGTVKFTKNNPTLTTCKIFEKTKHETHNDTMQHELFKYMLNWLESKIN